MTKHVQTPKAPKSKIISVFDPEFLKRDDLTDVDRLTVYHLQYESDLQV